MSEAVPLFGLGALFGLTLVFTFYEYDLRRWGLALIGALGMLVAAFVVFGFWVVSGVGPLAFVWAENIPIVLGFAAGARLAMWPLYGAKAALAHINPLAAKQHRVSSPSP
ncbi:MAG: hypothetical protein ACREQD_11825 [Candidatus Binataceae bacterium]